MRRADVERVERVVRRGRPGGLRGLLAELIGTRRRKGMALIFAMAAVIMLAAASAAILKSASEQQRMSVVRLDSLRAFEIADSAVNYALGKLAAGDDADAACIGFDPNTWADGSSGALANGLPDATESGVSPVAFEGGEFFVRVTEDTDSGAVTVLATALYEEQMRRVELTVLPPETQSEFVPWMNQAICSAPNLDVRGRVDINSDGTTPGSLHTNGDMTLTNKVSVSGDVSAVGDINIRDSWWYQRLQAFFDRHPRIEGGTRIGAWWRDYSSADEGVGGSIIAGADPVNVPDLDIDYYRQIATANGQYYTSDPGLGGWSFTFSPSFGVTINPINLDSVPGGVIFVEGDADIHSGSISGTGMIVASGDLTLSGRIIQAPGGATGLIAGDDVNIQRVNIPSRDEFIQRAYDDARARGLGHLAATIYSVFIGGIVMPIVSGFVEGMLSRGGAELDGVVWANDDLTIAEGGFTNVGAVINGLAVSAGIDPADSGDVSRRGFLAWLLGRPRRTISGINGKVDFTQQAPAPGGLHSELFQGWRVLNEQPPRLVWREVK